MSLDDLLSVMTRLTRDVSQVPEVQSARAALDAEVTRLRASGSGTTTAGAPDDLSAMTPLANMVRRSAYSTLRTFVDTYREDYPADRVAGIIAVAVCMNGQLIDALRATIAVEDAYRAASSPPGPSEARDADG
jgi:hypothetical protein